MEESEKSNLFETLKSVVGSIIEEKRNNPKYTNKLNEFNASVNLGLQMTADYFFWLNLTANDGKFKLARDKLPSYDLELIAAPEDLLYFLNRQNSVIHMVTKKNKYGNRKLVIGKGTTGRNLGKLLRLSKILVLQKIKYPKILSTEEYKSPKVAPKPKQDTLFKKKYKLLTATLLGIFLPSFLTFLFMLALEQIPQLWHLVDGDLGVFYSMILFNTFNLIYDIPLLGYGYWIVFIVWAVTGIFIGLICRDILKSLIIDGIAIGINIILYSIFVFIYFPSYPSSFVFLIEQFSKWYPGLASGLFIPFFLMIHIILDSFALPMLVLFTLIGGLINPRPEIYTIFDAKMASKVKNKYKGAPVSKKRFSKGKIETTPPASNKPSPSIQDGDK
ncbi:MAG: hypothetical protein ACFFBP_03875 [Promethearchaeota archaeon]